MSKIICSHPRITTTTPSWRGRRLGFTALASLLLLTQAACGEVRTFDGTDNNKVDGTIGATHTLLVRLAAPDYGDGVGSLAGPDRPNPRFISNTVNAQDQSIPNLEGSSDFLWQWGQFLDHDLDLTEPGAEQADIPVPLGDPFFDPNSTGTQVIPFRRSRVAPGTGTDADNPREQENEITSWIDASQVYGSDFAQAAALRTNDGTGRLATSAGDLLPFASNPPFFVAGDIRVNEQVGLIAMHTLFVREHNTIADEMRERLPDKTGDQIYEIARAIVGAEMQVITYNEFIPALLGPDALSPYTGYDPTINAGITNAFATAAFRLGHSMLNSTLLRLDANGDPIAEGHLLLRDAFFAPQLIIDEGGIEPLLRGLASQPSQKIDVFVVDAVRNFLFGQPGAGGLDLPSLNIQRGRDHGLPSYNDMRVALGLGAVASFADISADPEVQARLADAYGEVGLIDLWVGGLAEDHLPGAMVGELFHAILKQQFEALRDGDRFWYQNRYHGVALRLLEQQRLSDIIRRNTTIDTELPDDVFHVAP